MEERLSRFGVGPRMSLSAVTYGVLAGAATYARPDVCLLRWPPYAVLATVGWILLAMGVAMSLTGVITVMRAYNLERRFGQTYLDYRARVNEVIPIPRFWLRK
jgi:protein-S-isoprenylcysteine O-methyltransferase Ste14